MFNYKSNVDFLIMIFVVLMKVTSISKSNLPEMLLILILMMSMMTQIMCDYLVLISMILVMIINTYPPKWR